MLGSSETSVLLYKSARRHIPHKRNLSTVLTSATASCLIQGSSSSNRRQESVSSDDDIHPHRVRTALKTGEYTVSMKKQMDWKKRLPRLKTLLSLDSINKIPFGRRQRYFPLLSWQPATTARPQCPVGRIITVYTSNDRGEERRVYVT
jgi:hypothetical protein